MPDDSPDRRAAASSAAPNALPAGTRFGELEIVSTLAVGGFGIIYVAQDHALQRQVAIKEYMPSMLAQRNAKSKVSVRSGSQQETFDAGLRSFVNESRLLARFDHPSLLKVYRFWEANGTAYMVMPYLQGQTLRQARRAMSQPPDEAWVRRLVSALLEALELLHTESIWHRDIAPDNVFLPYGGAAPVLLDFGAARQVISDRAEGLTAILKPSYAPIEQYAESRQLRQGPWTDLYALGAMVHELVLGRTPPAATARSLGDDYQSLVTLAPAGYSPELLACIDWMLRVHPQDRPQSVAHLRAALDGRLVPPEPRRVDTSATPPPVGFEDTRLASDSEFAETRQLGDSDFLPTRALDAPDLLLEDAQAASAPAPLPEVVVMPPPSRRSSKRRAPPSPPRRWPWAVGLLAAGAGTALLVALVQPMLHRTPTLPQSDLAMAASAPASAASPAESAADPVLALVQSQEAARAASSPVAGGPAGAGVTPGTDKPLDKASDKAADKPVDKPGDRRLPQDARKRRDPAPVAAPPGAAPVAPAPVEHTPVVAQPLPASAPVVAEAEPASPSDACGKRVFIARALCLDEQCAKPRFHGHAECVALREAREQRARNRN
ncbi:serine/threonine-protein kinase [Pelomonas sp. APW6]|uniref:non-specific serine/threonine protein kinase n=1 Tax=Roseateles subflavus TaxID=3053353 RepID=A0ABT7LCB4_9BURK|nr:serine/threonine-protein kinase [Pelomonas sp. APW6]MDL5030493.1 serine/threonine-protein kinase [Pelomonas sp. APW6]